MKRKPQCFYSYQTQTGLNFIKVQPRSSLRLTLALLFSGGLPLSRFLDGLFGRSFAARRFLLCCHCKFYLCVRDL